MPLNVKEAYKELLEDPGERLSFAGLAFLLIMLAAGGIWSSSKIISLGTLKAPIENSYEWIIVWDKDDYHEEIVKDDPTLD